MKNLCSNCPKRNSCDTLCEQAREYADQDYVGREQAFNIRGLQRGNMRFRVPTNPEDKAKEAWLLYKQGKSYEDISIHLECDEDFIREILED